MNIEEVTEEEVSKNQDEYLDRVEKGEVFLVTRPDGTKYMMVPQDPNDLTYPPCDI
jgi:antitoxin (DNA-binding transcriptional repressor) of toxin-antitoxin stability system|tara:strand:+ start:366 stop:533 length:168 start_codon:yes stop_codon:yes gene_type:complete